VPVEEGRTRARSSSTEWASAVSFTERSTPGSRVRPLGTSRLCPRTAATTSIGVRPLALSDCGSSTMVSSRLRPPTTSMEPTPGICWKAGLMTSSASLVSRSMGTGAEKARVATGVWISRGSLESVACTLSRTSCAATSTFRSRSKRMTICETLSTLTERRVSRPERVLSASSSGLVTLRSIDSGSAPGSTVTTVTMGNSTSGIWSTPIFG
jgi:hypothetical protein